MDIDWTNFLKVHKLPKQLTHSRRKRWLDSLISVKEIEVGNLPTKKTPYTHGFIGDFYSTFKKEITPIYIQTLLENWREETTSQIILESKIYPDTKIRKRYYQERKTQIRYLPWT